MKCWISRLRPAVALYNMHAEGLRCESSGVCVLKMSCFQKLYSIEERCSALETEPARLNSFLFAL